MQALVAGVCYGSGNLEVCRDDVGQRLCYQHQMDLRLRARRVLAVAPRFAGIELDRLTVLVEIGAGERCRTVRRRVLLEVDVEGEQLTLAVRVEHIMTERGGGGEVCPKVPHAPLDSIAVSLAGDRVRRPCAVAVLN